MKINSLFLGSLSFKIIEIKQTVVIDLTRKSTLPLIYRSIRMDNNDIPLRSGKGEKYSFVNLKFHVDRSRGIDVAHTFIVNKLNQDKLTKTIFLVK